MPPNESETFDDLTPTDSPSSTIAHFSGHWRGLCAAFDKAGPGLDRLRGADRDAGFELLINGCGEAGDAFYDCRQALIDLRAKEQALRGKRMVRLIDLNPRWVTSAGRTGAGLSFDCPGTCCATAAVRQRMQVLFRNPMDGGDPSVGEPRWNRSGSTFDDLTLTPSIDASASGHFHGWISNGEVT